MSTDAFGELVERGQRIARQHAMSLLPNGANTPVVVDRIVEELNGIGLPADWSRAVAHQAVSGGDLVQPERYQSAYGPHRYETAEQFTARTGRLPGGADPVQRFGHDRLNSAMEGQDSAVVARLKAESAAARQPFRRESEKIGAAGRAREAAEQQRQREREAAALPGRWW